MPKKSIVIYGETHCSGCRDARTLLDDLKIEHTFRDTKREPLTEAEVRELFGNHPTVDFISTRGVTYKELGLEATKVSRAALVKLVAAHSRLLRRPIFARGKDRHVGMKKEEVKRWLGEE